MVAAAEADGRGGPLADGVHGDDGGLVEGRGEEGAGGMALMMAGEEDLAGVASVQAPADLARDVQLLPQPDGDGLPEAGEPLRRVRGIGLEQPLELRQRLLVEGDVIELLGEIPASLRQ